MYFAKNGESNNSKSLLVYFESVENIKLFTINLFLIT